MPPGADLEGRVVVSVETVDVHDAAPSRALDWAADWAESIGRPLTLVAPHGPSGAVDLTDRTSASFVAIARQQAQGLLGRAHELLVRRHPAVVLAECTVRATPGEALVAASGRAYAVIVGIDPRRGRLRPRARVLDLVLPYAAAPVVVVGGQGRSAVDAPVVVGLGPQTDAQVLGFAAEAAMASGRLLQVVRAVPEGAPSAARHRAAAPDTCFADDTRLLGEHERMEATVDALSSRYPQLPTVCQVLIGSPLDVLADAAVGAALLVVGVGAAGPPMGTWPDRLIAAATGRRCVGRAVALRSPCPVALVPRRRRPTPAGEGPA